MQNKMIHRLITTLMLVSTQPLLAADDVVARVGDHAITISQFEARASELRRGGYKHLTTLDRAARLELLDGVLATELLLLEGLRRGLDQDSTIATQVERTRSRALMNQLYNTQAVAQEYTWTEEELQQYFVSAGFDTEVLSRHIVCSSKEEALQVLGKLLDGADFTAMVAQHSIPMIQRRFGKDGWVGWFKLGEVYDELREPLTTMPVGSFYFEPVQTAIGWHVFFLKTRRPVDFESQREFTEKRLRIQKRANDMERYVIGLRSSYDLTPQPDGQAALRSIAEGTDTYEGPERVLFTWKDGGRLTLRQYMAMLRAGRAQHPSGLDSAGVYRVADNLAGRQIMNIEAERLGLEQAPEVLAQVRDKMRTLVARRLYEVESAARGRQFTDAEAREFYDQNLDLFTREDGKVTEFDFLRDSIRGLLSEQTATQAMDAFLAELRQTYESQVEIYPEVLDLAFTTAR